MNFSHLMDPKSIRPKCKATNNECYWIPAGDVRATHGENVHIIMHCRRCGRREDIFLSKEEYYTQQRLIEREIGNV